MITIDKAIEIACEAHKNQKDKCGLPYIMHPIRVASCFKDESAFIIAILHDVFEDAKDGIKSWLVFELEENKYILEALELLNHKKGVPYEQYIDELCNNSLAMVVKLADLSDNMDKERSRIAVSLMSNKSSIERFNKKQAKYKVAYEKIRLVLNKEYPNYKECMFCK